MKSPVFSLALSCSILGAAALPGFANQPVVVNSQLSRSVISQTAGVIISLPMGVTIDVGQKQDYPLTVPLAQPLLDLQGNTLVPANSPVSIKFKPEQGGARIVAESIVVNGQIVPIQAATDVIPGNTITQREAAEVARQNSAVYGNLLGATMGAIAPLSKKADAFEHGGMIGGAIGIVSGLSSPKNLRVVQLPQGSVYVLALRAPIVLPTLAIAPPPAAQPTLQSTPSQPPQFTFRTVAEYSEGLEQLLRAYEQGQVSKSEARQAIVAADQYATTTLTPKLYPPAGQRNRVAQLFDYVYAIDQR
jgi:hypothetical protein